MKLLVIGPDMQDLGRVKNFTGVQAYYLARELRRCGVELAFINAKHPNPTEYLRTVDTQGADHVLALGLRWFTHQPPGCASIIKARVKGAVTQMHDGVVHTALAEHMHGIDCTFMFRDDGARVKDWARYSSSNHYIGWASDPEILYPEQNGTLRILIDHPYYKQGQPDLTESVTRDVQQFVDSGTWRHLWPRVYLRRLVNGGAETLCKGDVLKPFERRHIPFVDIAKEYRRAHIYCVTHRESVGLTALELAFCGALTVAPAGMLYQDRLATIRHVEYEGAIPWRKVLDSIDIGASVAKAREQSWPRVVDRMLAWFGSWP